MPTSPLDVYILATAYSGSTLLGNALNAHPDIAYAGELSRLPFFGRGVPLETCLFCKGMERECPVWTHEHLGRFEAAGPRRSIDVFRELSGKPIVVDGSKWTTWFGDVVADGPLSPGARVIVTTRSPFAFAASVKRHTGKAARAGRAARKGEAGRAMSALDGAIQWRSVVRNNLRAATEQGLPVQVVRYEDFALDPEPTLRRVTSFLGTGFDPAMLRFWEHDLHAIGGNVSAYAWYGPRFQDPTVFPHFAEFVSEYAARPFGGWVDEKWRTELDDEEKRTIAATPLVWELGELLGYDMAALSGFPAPPESDGTPRRRRRRD